MQRAYRDTVAALRERRLAPADVATAARLTKRPAAYARSRGRAREAAYEALLAAGRDDWRAGGRVRHYRAVGGLPVWLPQAGEGEAAGTHPPTEPPPYDIAHYLAVLDASYVSRLRKAFAPDDFAQLFRPTGQAGRFDRPLAEVAPLWIAV